MTTTLEARNLVLEDVHDLLKLEMRINNSFTSLLSLEPLTEIEQQDLEKIRNNFNSYYRAGVISEGEVKFLLFAPLLWVAGFYHPSIRITLEEGIAAINIEAEDTIIKGRMDILAVTNVESREVVTPLWILLIEAKRSSVDAMEGLPQLLTYAYKNLAHQESTWGLTTNGKDYQFVYIQQGEPPIYQLLPALSLIRPENAIELLQVFKAICQLCM